ncbi:MAG: M3 family metallopeptidase [Bacteroidaceae bacterium]|nr:M3 family metallopeptidase [Bacteroidaceae bacterium]
MRCATKSDNSSIRYNSDNTVRTNPFLVPYGTPHDTIPFDKLQLSDYEEAFMEGIRREDEQIERIVNNPERPTFDNTIIDGKDDSEGYYDLLDRVSTTFFNLLSAESNDDMEALAQKMQPLLTKHANDISLNPKLFERIQYVKRHPDRKLTDEERVLLNESYEGFVRSGALLDEQQKQHLRALTEEASMLSLQFSQNLLKEEKAFTLHITDPQQLDGLPDSARDAAQMAAKEAGKEGWLITLDMPIYGPFMTYSTQRDLRRQLYHAKNTVCTHDNDNNNFEICRRLVNLRREVAQLLGYKTYADYVLKERMASNRRTVDRLLNQLLKAYKPTAKNELRELERFAKTIEGKSFRLQPWDVSFYSHKLQLQRYRIDSEMLRPYFRLDRVIEGVFNLANRLYGITFKPNADISVYHPDVKAYEVFDNDGSYLATFYADFHPRKGKQSGAWMTEYQGQCIDRKGRNIRPHVSVVLNITKPTADKPSLLTLGEVETFLHEFGHSLHGMFANTRFESLSGTNVRWDFVELPSQFMENYAIERDFLNTFARHYQTDEPIPSRLLSRIRRSRNFMVAYGCVRQVSFSLLDMAYYTLKTPLNDDIASFEKQAWRKAVIMPQQTDTCMTVQFSHIMAGGYAAGYYSYKWAEVLEADAFSVFRKHGIFDKNTAQRFRDCILSKGGTQHPMTLYKNFRGGEPTISALLRRDGIRLPKERNKHYTVGSEKRK